MSSQKLL